VLQVQVRVPASVTVQVACGSQPPFEIAQAPEPTQVIPSPVYPALHVQVLVPGPVDLQVALGSHAPPSALQLLMALQS
jgi:hypothetical protein